MRNDKIIGTVENVDVYLEKSVLSKFIAYGDGETDVDALMGQLFERLPVKEIKQDSTYVLLDRKAGNKILCETSSKKTGEGVELHVKQVVNMNERVKARGHEYKLLVLAQ